MRLESICRLGLSGTKTRASGSSDSGSFISSARELKSATVAGGLVSVLQEIRWVKTRESGLGNLAGIEPNNTTLQYHTMALLQLQRASGPRRRPSLVEPWSAIAMKVYTGY